MSNQFRRLSIFFNGILNLPELTCEPVVYMLRNAPRNAREAGKHIICVVLMVVGGAVA